MSQTTAPNIRAELEIAVIGMAGRFPGAANIEEFWNCLKEGRDCMIFLSEEELKELGEAPSLLEDSDYVKSPGGVLEGKELFDSYFFDYTPGEAEIMDPQVRMFHEGAWEALEDAGYDPGSYNGLIGLYVGASSSFYWEAMRLLSGKGQEMGEFAVQHFCDKDFLSTRVAYKLDLKGPAFTLQTACSTSLVGIHLACQAVLNGECEMALAGGVSIYALPDTGYIYQEGMISSSDGHCRAFDARADGTTGGSGMAVVLLKSLDDAIADRDNIYALVKGSAINNDGIDKSGYSAPGRRGQTQVIQIAHQLAEVEPESISYIEAHGTGTSLGDPIEIEALTTAFNTDKKNFCGIGSVKSNIGHLDAAAGASGFIKVVLALKHRLIPPSLHFENPNPKIDFENSPFYVNSWLKEWKSDGAPLIAGVSSLGIGGTNAHVVLQEAPAVNRSTVKPAGDPDSQPYRLILLSAKNLPALERMTENLAQYFRKNILDHDNHENPTNPALTLADAAYTLQVGRKPFKHRRMMVCSTVKETVEVLDTPASAKVHTSFMKVETRPVVFMFSGQGSQYVNMGLELYRKVPVFRNEVDRCFHILENIMGHNIKDILYPAETSIEVALEEEASEKIDSVIYSGPIKFTFEYALAKLLMHWGIKPYAVIGHSFGEYAAAQIAGVLSLEDVLAIVVLRGKLMYKIPAGVMMSVDLPEHELKPLLGEELSLAAVNAPSSCIVAGPTPAAHRLEKQLNDKGHECLRINFPKASHSKMMKPILKEFDSFVSQVKLNKPKMPYISGLTGTWISVEQALNPGYWSRHMVQTVRFSDGVKKIRERETPVFIQVGCDRGLPLFIKHHQQGDDEIPVVNLVKHKKEKMSDRYYLLNSIGQVWLHGAKIDWAKFYQEEERYRVPLPTYPFQRKTYWFEGDLYSMGEKQLLQRSLPLEKSPDIADCFYLPSWKPTRLPVLRPACIPGNETWLVFIDESTLGTGLIKKLQQHNLELISVKPGERFSKINDNEFRIRPGVKDDYHTLFTQLGKTRRIPVKVLYLWCIPDNDSGLTLESLEEGSVLGFKSLIFLLQSMGKLRTGEGHIFQLFIITRRMQETPGQAVLHPESALALGLVKVSPQEYDNIIARSIDIDIVNPGTPAEARLIDRLAAELITDTQDTTIAYRGNNRLVQTFEPVCLDEIKPSTSILKEEGTYLITGGLSGIGLELAEYLAREVRARLILIGRSGFPARDQWDHWLAGHDKGDATSLKILKLKEFESRGAEVLALSANVAHLEELTDAVSWAQKHFGGINGVIHSAGVPEGAIIQRKTEEMMRHVLEAKVKGTLVLHHVLKDIELDFFVLFSSGNAIVPILGQVGYCAANAFLDAFAHYRTEVYGALTISINWDRWRNTGMSIAIEAKHREITGEDLEQGITPQQGLDAFLRILANEHSQVVVAARNMKRLVEEFNKSISTKEKIEENLSAPPPPQKNFYPRPDLSTDYVPPGSEIEHTLADIWQPFFGIESLGVNDDFFELGGDSLKAMALIANVHKKMNVRVPVADFFSRGTTIHDLADYISSSAEEYVFSSINPVEKKEYYPVSSAQKRLYILYQMDEKSKAYNISQVIILEGAIKKEPLEETFRKLICRHESLRTSFATLDGQLIQKIHPEARFKIDQYEVGDEDLDNLIDTFEISFDLANAPLLKVVMAKAPGEKHILMANMHHIMSDGFSMDILVNEFYAFYNEMELPALKLQYKEYSEWQRIGESKKETLKQMEEYWLRQFEDDVSVLNLPQDFPRPATQSFEGSMISFGITTGETNALKEIAAAEGATLFMLLLSLFYIFLSKITGQEDIIVGTPTAGRKHADLEKIIGMFVNTLALRNYPSGGKTFKIFLREIKEKIISVFENQDYQLEDIIEKVVVQKDVSRNPLFDVMFVLQDFLSTSGAEGMTEEEKEGMKVKSYPYEWKSAKFDLSLIASADEKFFFTFEFCTKLFKQDTIEKFARYFAKMVSSIIENPEKKLSGIEIITGEEKEQILYDINDTGQEHPKDKTLHKLFEEQVEKTPDYIAIVGQALEAAPGSSPYNIQLVYKELDEKSDRLAHLIQEKCVEPGFIVGLLLERSIETIIGILGILKAGGAYLPIEPGYPRERIEYMIKDSSMGVLVTTAKLQVKVGIEERSIEIIDICNPSSFPALTSTSSCPVSVANLAYIIYTSGSTGRPKGVAVEHASIFNTIYWRMREYKMKPGHKALLLFSFAFDGFITSFFTPVVSGALVVHLSDDNVKDITGIKAIIVSIGITHFICTPSFYRSLLEISTPGELPALEIVTLAGEQVQPDMVEKSKQVNPLCEIVNEYGPTEGSVAASIYRDLRPAVGISIGKPISNTRIYIIDKYKNLSPVGIPGELVIKGEGLSRGYLNNPGLTAEKFNRAVIRKLKRAVISSSSKFSPNDQCPMSNDRFYLTGDLARWLSDGNLEFLGRIDHQVKIRGFRIETGEIENCLINIEYIKEALVIDRKDENGDRYLAAYIVSVNPIEGTGIRNILSKSLPDYMIPSYFVPLEAIPLTPSGKIDRKLLPEPGFVKEQSYKAPRNKIEEQLVEIWSEVLGINSAHVSQLRESISIDNNFFELGGHSLKAIQVISKIHKEFNIKVSLVELFRGLTIRNLAEDIDEMEKNIFQSLEPTEKKEYYPLSSAQGRIYFTYVMDPGNVIYNSWMMYTLAGHIDVAGMERAFKALIQRHESLRTSFIMVEKEAVQIIHDQADFAIEYFEAGPGVDEIVKEFVRPFDFSKAPLLRVRLVKEKEDRYIFMVDIPHIITDGVSATILQEDFLSLYAGEELPPLKLHFKDFSQWQNRLFREGVIKQQEEYWLNRFEDNITLMKLPTDFPRPGVLSHNEGERVEFSLDKELMDTLYNREKETGTTTFMFMLAAYSILLFKYTGQEDILVGFPVTGRSHNDLLGIIGMFVNMLPMKNRLQKASTFSEFLAEVKRNALDAYENQDYQYPELVSKLGLQGSLNENPLLTTVFTMNNFDQYGENQENSGRENLFSVTPYDYDRNTMPFDLHLIVTEEEGMIDIRLEYLTQLFKKTRIQEMSKNLVGILKQVLENPGITIEEVEIIYDSVAMELKNIQDDRDFEF